eukprot:2773532-Rhodomonas_salina.1
MLNLTLAGFLGAHVRLSAKRAHVRLRREREGEKEEGMIEEREEEREEGERPEPPSHLWCERREGGREGGREGEGDGGKEGGREGGREGKSCLLYTSPSPRDRG